MQPHHIAFQFFRRIALLLPVILLACSPEQVQQTPREAYGTKPVYDYPIDNPYAATIITMPPAMKVDYSAVPQPSQRTITLFKDRKIPEGFWYQDGLRYGELLQSHPAKLVYVIGGTGADAQAEDMRLIADILYTGGFSVVLLPSPTNPNFIINASENFTPGSPLQDTQDLYHLMKVVDAKVSKESSVTGRMLMGYSLGAWNSAYVAQLDDEEHALNFSRVLLVNPPLSLYTSMRLIDTYLFSALPHGINSADSFIKGMVARFSSMTPSGDALDFSNERLLIEAFNKYPLGDARLATIIGLSFRLSAVDMIFTADVMGHNGYIFPKNQEFTTATDMNSYLGLALRTSFRNYLDDVYIPKFRTRYPSLTKEELIAKSSLESLSGYITSSGKLRLITNKDDIVLGPGELAKLTALFGTNATVFPNGGHLGNFGHPAVAYQIIQYLQH